MLIRKNYRPKLLLILFAFLILFIFVVARLFLIQVYQRDFFSLLAKQQYVTEISTNPPRAVILDRNGTPLAMNGEKFSAFILPMSFNSKSKTLDVLKANFKNVYDKVIKNKRRRFFWLERHLSDERLREIKSYNCRDIYFLAEPERFYPFLSLAHVVGFTNVDNLGISGIELEFDKRIGGTPTTFILEKDARSGYFYFHKDIKEKGTAGESVTLTIDSNIQFFAFDALKESVIKHSASSGAALVMDPDSGHIISMVSYPGFDPNQIPIKNLENTKNIVVTECFELGSVMKVFSALAALEEDVVTVDEEIDCEGKSTYIDGFRVENWKSLGPGLHPFWKVVSKSNNVGIAKVAKRLGPKLYHHLMRLGFGKKTGVRFPGERSGFVNPPRRWSRSSIIVLSFGYEIMATILQLGKAYSVIANGGNSVDPMLVIRPSSRKYNLTKSRLYDEDKIEQIKEILELKDWMKQSYGIEGYRIMGKTGTSRIVKNGKYSSKDNICVYAGIVEKGDYKRVIVTFIKEPKESIVWASQIALPLFNKIAKKIVVYDLSKGIIKS